MRSPDRSALIASLAPGILLLAFAGCASTGPQRSAKAVGTMTETHDELLKVRKQIDRTLGSLAGVMDAAPDQLRSSFDRYAKDVDALRSDADRTKKRVRELKEKKADYVATWGEEQSQVKDEELRHLSEDRRALVGGSLDRMVASLGEASREFDPFLSNLADVRKVLGNDLTPAGQSLVGRTVVVQEANDRGARVARSIDAALDATTEMAGRLSSSGASK